jgi:hypothetical protein
MDESGRVGDRAMTGVLGWQPGDRLTLTADAGVVIARRDPGGMVTMPAKPYLVIPAALRAAARRPGAPGGVPRPGRAGRVLLRRSARRHDKLLANHARAKQQVEDYEAELGRLRMEHAKIVRPDARLWWGIAILITFTVLGVVLPLWVIATAHTT